MDHFKKTSVAVLLTLLVVALCCVWGYSRAHVDPVALPDDGDHQPAGESILNHYLDQIEDGAELFSLNAEDYLARQNLVLDRNYNGLLAVTAVDHTFGRALQDVADDHFVDRGLGSRDILLYIDRRAQEWTLSYGSYIQGLVDQNEGLPALVHGCLDGLLFSEEPDFDSEDFDPEAPLPTYDLCLMRLAGNVALWYETTIPMDKVDDPQYTGKELDLSLGAVLSSVLLTLAVNIWWILLLFLALEFVDQFRIQRYFAQLPPGGGGKPFRPILFWHRTGSRWYERMHRRFLDEQEEDEEEEEPFFYGDGSYTGGYTDPNAGQTEGPGSAYGQGSYNEGPYNEGPYGGSYNNDSYDSGPYGDGPYSDYVGPGYAGDPNFGPQQEGDDLLQGVSEQLRRFFDRL